MQKCANAEFHKKERIWILSPFGKFIGYGAAVTIFPRRLVGPNYSMTELGEMTMRSLLDSKSTGYHIRDHEQYSIMYKDSESQRISEKYYEQPTSLSCFATRFITLSLSLSKSAKTVTITRMLYCAKYRSLQGDFKLSVRVSKGPEAIGEAMMSLVE